MNLLLAYACYKTRQCLASDAPETKLANELSHLRACKSATVDFVAIKNA
jgi:hypothetical protein